MTNRLRIRGLKQCRTAPDGGLRCARMLRRPEYRGVLEDGKERSARTGDTWCLVSDGGPYLNGHDAAPCPLAFLSVGMAASFMNEILALAKTRGVEIRKLKLIQDNYYTMKGYMPKRTMVGGAENIDLQVEIDCDLSDAALHEFLIDAT